MEGESSGKGSNLKKNRSNNNVTDATVEEDVPKSSDISESLFQRDGMSEASRLPKVFSVNDRDTIVDEVEEIK